MTDMTTSFFILGSIIPQHFLILARYIPAAHELFAEDSGPTNH